jgi:serine/threonine-protein kinase
VSEDRFDRFILLRPIRKGGLGLLSLAWDEAKSKVVALKRSGSKSGDAAARFADEIQLSKRLQHANLVRTIDSGDADGVAWLALEWLEGQDLDALLERARKFDQRVPLPIAGAIVRQVLAALEYAHGHGVVHRDVSPRNVMIGYDGRVRLVDYGLALSQVKSTRTLPGVAPGTVGFLAPEQRQGKSEPASDLYAVGALLWFALTGAPFFGDGEDGNSKEPFRHRLHGLAGDLPPGLVTFLWRALQKSPTQRFEGAREMGRELEAAMGTPLAPEAAVGGFLTQLFPVEKRLAEDELVAIQQRFMPSPRTTMVVDRAPPAKRRTLLWIAAIAGVLVIGEVAWLLVWRSPPPPPPPPPKVVVTPPPPPPIQPPGIVEEPLPPPTYKAPRPSARTPRPVAPPPPLVAPAAPAARIEAARTKVGLAEVKLREADYAGAIALAGEAIQLGAGADAYLVRGYAALRAGRAADAERDFQHVLERDPQNPAARSGLKSAQEQK